MQSTLNQQTENQPIRIGVSSCLLGEKVRFNGGHSKDGFLVDTFGRYVEWLPVCPEVEIGLGTPRETLRLVRGDHGIRLIMPKSGEDHTASMRAYAKSRVAALAKESLCGYILKKNSPSCGMERVKVYDANQVPSKTGRGLFAEVLLERFPNLPVEEEGRLSDPRLRENFVERVFAYHRIRRFFSRRWKIGELVAFHTAHKLQLLAHSAKAYQSLGRLVAEAKGIPRKEVAALYESEFMGALAKMATTRRHVNVLQHICGYFKKGLDQGAKEELMTLIEDYRTGIIPLIVPLTLIRHYVRRFGIAYLMGQVYLAPHPKELMLRNHV
jgi:uncharacterized protein YbgA (DUF1722 family)/uncharacterized protein YbbK (DUF523 family)